MLLDFYNNDSQDNSKLIDKKHALIDEQTSPLHRIMWAYNIDEPHRRSLENNICTVHIGNGYFLSVAHNLRVQAGYYKSIDEAIYKTEIFTKLDGSQNRQMEQFYLHDEYTNKRYLNTNDPANLTTIANILKQKRFDTRWVSLAQKNICKPYLIFQFKNNAFYGDSSLSSLFDSGKQLYESEIQKYTFLVEVELVNAFYGADIALYKVVNTPQEIIDKIPSAAINTDFLDESHNKFYCLQSSPSGPAGRLLNVATIEGILDHFNVLADEVGGNYLLEGYRYLIKGYFRFGSSGAPYLYYNEEKERYEVNAIQSEASGVQLAINNNRDGNFQYVNAIASPLYIIKEDLQRYLSM